MPSLESLTSSLMAEEVPYQVTSFYGFAPIGEAELDEVEGRFRSFAKQTDLCGLIITAKEGLNATLALNSEPISKLKDMVCSIKGFENTSFKDSVTPSKPFKRFKIKRRDEIVTLNRTDLVPSGEHDNHLSPAEWHRTLTEEEDFVLIDTRNRYETDLGVFQGALDPRMEMFSEFGDWVKDSGIPKDQKVLMYCTGGIRCEKAILEMRTQGYENVYQLEGGILKYLEEFPGEKFEGECFVFDHRVAVDQKLEPSDRYRLCPHCGDPGDQRIACERCGKAAVICGDCQEHQEFRTCSKDCSHHHRITLQGSFA